jgi:hypothetical protein
MFEILLFINFQISMNVFDIHHVYLYNILGGRLSICPSRHPSRHPSIQVSHSRRKR